MTLNFNYVEEPTKDEISLCNSCNCMTHDIKENAGRRIIICGKCKSEKRQDTSSSESEIIAKMADYKINVPTKKLNEALNQARAEGLPSKSMDEAVNVFLNTIKTLNTEIGNVPDIDSIMDEAPKLFEAGRQSAQKEWDDGAKLGVEQCNKNFLNMLDTAFKNGETKQRAEKQEQVRKLKEWIIKNNNYHFNTERLIEVIETEIFPSSAEDVRGNSTEFPKSDCAEQPKKIR